MRDLGDVGPELILDAYCHAGRGLAAAHARGIWHRDFRPENILVHIEEDPAGGVVRVWAKVGDFGSAQKLAPHDHMSVGTYAAPELGGQRAALPSGQRAGGDRADQYSFALALWESLTAGRRPPNGEELMSRQLHAVLGKALMLDPGQRWADMTALVDAIERGRRPTAAIPGPGSVRDRIAASHMIERAIAQAEDGLFSGAHQRWREAHVELAGNSTELGHGGLALAAALFGAAAEKTGAARRRGYQRCVEVLDDTIASLEAAGELETIREARLLALEACEEWKNTYPANTPEHLSIDRRALSFRDRG